MTNTGILTITIGVILVTIIICVTNFLCNYYNDWKDEKIKDSRKLIKQFEKKYITRDIHGTYLDIKSNYIDSDIVELIDDLKSLL
jgi:hypothetical protein